MQILFSTDMRRHYMKKAQRMTDKLLNVADRNEMRHTDKTNIAYKSRENQFYSFDSAAE